MKLFNIYDRVKFQNTGDDYLDHLSGIVMGYYADDTYIVLFNTELPSHSFYNPAIVMPEHHLVKIEE